jgi:acyl-CoA synthetase (NDP forming)
VSGGFGETGAEGRDRQVELGVAARESGLRVLGPNCVGVHSPRGRQGFQPRAPQAAGSVSILSHSGGLAGDFLHLGAAAGLGFAHVVSMGNCVDVGPGELLDWLLDDDETTLIGVYLEGLSDGGRLVEALKRARGRKPVVILPGGRSQQGARAVSSHTGAMTGDDRGWRTVADATGATLVGSAEELVSVLAYLQRYPQASAQVGGTVVVGPGGGASVLTTDAADAAGLTLTAVAPPVQEMLRGLGYGAGTSVANPIEIPVGPAAPPDAYVKLLDPLLSAQPYADVMAHVNVAAYYGYGPANINGLLDTIAVLGQRFRDDATRVAVVIRNQEVGAADHVAAITAACREANVAAFSRIDLASVAISAAQRRDATVA